MSGAQLPKISLVTSCLDQLPLLQESMHSVLNQGYPKLEYILIDRGSSDGTREYLREFTGPPVIFQEAPGLDRKAAINKGLAMARGSIMGWLDPLDKHFHLGLFKIALFFFK